VILRYQRRSRHDDPVKRSPQRNRSLLTGSM
jgi:hypothetical protein